MPAEASGCDVSALEPLPDAFSVIATAGQHFGSHADAKRAAEHVKEHAASADIVDE